MILTSPGLPRKKTTSLPAIVACAYAVLVAGSFSRLPSARQVHQGAHMLSSATWCGKDGVVSLVETYRVRPAGRCCYTEDGRRYRADVGAELAAGHLRWTFASGKSLKRPVTSSSASKVRLSGITSAVEGSCASRRRLSRWRTWPVSKTLNHNFYEGHMFHDRGMNSRFFGQNTPD